ncbi:MAG: hypothetical protein QOK20_3389, partial [Acidimicrobiaceae bacterium]|nr:hypothetical protein [Acidimicrobiaceae bacterium]
MSSHREAPEISKDPVADSTDVYAFVSPDDPHTVTLISNYIPLEGPAAGPNFYEFGDDVLYQIHIDNDGDGVAEVTYGFRFTTTVQNPHTVLYNTGPITSLTDGSFNRRQTYSVSRTNASNVTTVLASGLTCPPCNIGPLSTPHYPVLARQAVHALPGGRTVFAGQRAEGFYVDLGSVFDLGNLRPFENLHASGNLPARNGVTATTQPNVHSNALNVPLSDLTAGSPVIGVWA